MTGRDDWSPDEALGTETFEQGDEALDEESRIDPEIADDVLTDPSLDPNLVADERELEEARAEFDDPETLVTLDGMMDDPDGGGPTARGLARQGDREGWDLDVPLARGRASEEPGTEPSTEPD